MLHSKQKFTHSCSEWSIVKYGTSKFCMGLWMRPIEQPQYGKNDIDTHYDFYRCSVFSVNSVASEHYGPWCTEIWKWNILFHDDVIKWKHFPRYWPFVRGIHRSPVNSPHKGQWCGASMFCFSDLRPNKRLSKQSWGWWFETPSDPLWRLCNAAPNK